tara:strand:+ start:380 stop:820 length:441 start_codon:yes stop_codon:yes gene_type:complete
MSQIVELFTDGSCKGNPGTGGWGILLRSGETEREIYGGEINTTNNRMELTAVIEGLNALNRACNVRVTTDSQYVKNGITQWIHNWKKNNWKTSSKTQVKNVDLWRKLEKAIEKHTVEWVWVKGHTGHIENERADELANKGANEVGK